MPATYTTRRNVAMTPQLRARLQQLLARQGKDVTEADLIRQVIREFLDCQGDLLPPFTYLHDLACRTQ